MNQSEMKIEKKWPEMIENTGNRLYNLISCIISPAIIYDESCLKVKYEFNDYRIRYVSCE